ncbi:hypothetical protein D9M68_657830 [compost metagenome]
MRGQGLHRQRQLRVRRHPALHLLQHRPADRSGLTLAAELKLPAGALEEHHQLRRHFRRHLAPQVLFDER